MDSNICRKLESRTLTIPAGAQRSGWVANDGLVWGSFQISDATEDVNFQVNNDGDDSNASTLYYLNDSGAVTARSDLAITADNDCVPLPAELGTFSRFRFSLAGAAANDVTITLFRLG